ncbi:hypothetical protein FRC01_007973 [Tulasnella sp. 417]|nr:hypothetical protein FRC01_007973 [Tulasnella sp. 417]
MVLVATHFHELFRSNFFPSYLPVRFSHMQVIIANEAVHSVSGSENDARGFAGIEDELDTAARGQLLDGFTFLFSDHLVNQNIAALLDEQMAQTELEELREAEAVTRRFCSLDLGKSTDLRLRLAEVVGRRTT